MHLYLNCFQKILFLWRTSKQLILHLTSLFYYIPNWKAIMLHS